MIRARHATSWRPMPSLRLRKPSAETVPASFLESGLRLEREDPLPAVTLQMGQGGTKEQVEAALAGQRVAAAVAGDLVVGEQAGAESGHPGSVVVAAAGPGPFRHDGVEIRPAAVVERAADEDVLVAAAVELTGQGARDKQVAARTPAQHVAAVADQDVVARATDHVLNACDASGHHP